VIYLLKLLITRVSKKTVLKSYKSIRRKPLNFQRLDSNLFSNEFIKKISSSYIVRVKKIFLYNTMLLNKNGKHVLSKHTHMNSGNIKSKIKKYLNSPQINNLNNFEEIDSAFWVIDEKSNRYFHWLTDTLMRFFLVVKSKESGPILIHEDLLSYPYIKESLDILNINHVMYDKNTLLRVNNLNIVSHVSESGNYNKEIINAVRKGFTKNVNSSKPSERIWISRSNSDYRKIKNLEEIMPLLKKYNFEIIKPEENSLEKNIEVFNSCKVVGGLHGAGLTNMLFMQKNTSVIEVRRHGDVNNNCYYSLASDLDINYFYVKAESETSDFFNSDCDLNIDELSELFVNYFEQLFG
jgi:capsular polysaccharide biosynthesis protein